MENVPSSVLLGIVLAVENAMANSPLLTVLGSPRLPHVLLQSEVETMALDGSGAVLWRVAHSDVIAAAELVGGKLALRSYGGVMSLLDPRDGRTLER